MSRTAVRSLLLSAILILGSLAAPARAQDVLDGIAAVVNGDVITFSQVRELVGARERSLREQYKGEELVNKVREVRLAALNDLIDRQLIIQEFKKLEAKGASIPDHVIDERVQLIIREEFGGDRQAFVRTLEAQGYTLSRFKAIEKEKIIVQAMTSNNARGEAVVTPQQIEAFYNEHRGEYTTPEQVKLRMIVLKKDDDAASKQKMAEEIRQKVKDGAQFDQLAQMYSEDSSQDSGGDWGWIDRKTLNEKLSDVAFRLKAGQVSEPIEIGDNLYLLYCEARKNASVKPLAEQRADIEKKLSQEARQKLRQKWVEGLRAKAYIKTY